LVVPVRPLEDYVVFIIYYRFKVLDLFHVAIKQIQCLQLDILLLEREVVLIQSIDILLQLCQFLYEDVVGVYEERVL
jgi:hypothetical protein